MERRAARDDVLRRTEEFVRERLAGEATGHDWWHVWRVRRLALAIGREEGADPYVVELAALLHDVADRKFHGDETVGPRLAGAWLRSLGVDAATVDHVTGIVATISFKGAAVTTPMATKEGAVVQDADRLDALGAIGVARAFAYGGFRGRPLHDPDVPIERHGAADADPRCAAGPTIHHFSEKLLLLKDRMNTAAGRRIAEDRHRFLEQFLDRFLAEWDGRA